MATYNLTTGRNAKIGMCGDCHAPIWRGVDADVCGLSVILDREPLTPEQCANAWPDLYVIRMNRIYMVFAPRPISNWETAHSTHRCKEK